MTEVSTIEAAQSVDAFNVVADRKELLAAVSFAHSKVIDRKLTIPVLACVRLSGVCGALEVAATDLDVETRQIVGNVKFDNDTPKALCIYSHSLVAALSSVSNDKVRIKSSDGSVAIITAGDLRIETDCLPVNDFPLIGQVDAAGSIDFDCVQLLSDLKRLAPFASTEETRYYLNGIYVHVAGDQLKMAVTDGHRLSMIERSAPDGSEIMPGMIIPNKTIKILMEVLSKREGLINFEFGSTGWSSVRFNIGGLTISSKMIDGTFPDYTRVIPSRCGKTYSTNVTDLSAAVKKLSALAKASGSKSCPVKFADRKLSFLSPELGKAEVSLKGKWSRGFPEIGFNGNLLQAALKVMTGDIEIEVSDCGAPTRISQADAPEHTYVLMPMRV